MGSKCTVICSSTGIVCSCSKAALTISTVMQQHTFDHLDAAGLRCTVSSSKQTGLPGLWIVGSSKAAQVAGTQHHSPCLWHHAHSPTTKTTPVTAAKAALPLWASCAAQLSTTATAICVLSPSKLIQVIVAWLSASQPAAALLSCRTSPSVLVRLCPAAAVSLAERRL